MSIDKKYNPKEAVKLPLDCIDQCYEVMSLGEVAATVVSRLDGYLHPYVDHL